MKTKLALLAIIAGAAMMSCQKEAELGPSYLTDDSRELRSSGIRNPQTVTTNRVAERFGYDSKSQLELVNIDGRLQKRFEYDSEGKLTVLTLADRNEEIRFRYELGQQPVDAVRVKLFANGGQEEIADIVYSFDEFGRKISETETERATGVVTQYVFEYDESDRLISTQKNINDEFQSLTRPDGFEEGYSHLAGLDVLALEPGTSLQKGLPRNILVDDASGQTVISYTYSLNADRQTESFTTSTNGRRAIRSRVTY